LHLPEDARIAITPIPGAASDREYWRVGRAEGMPPVILSRHHGARAENDQFAALARMLGRHGIRAPKVFAENTEKRLLWVEDLGENRLDRMTGLPAKQATAAALREVARLHQVDPDALTEQEQNLLQPEFSKSFYKSEQNYFLMHGAEIDSMHPERWEITRQRPEFDALAESLAALPKRLVHRDFQSQNLLYLAAQNRCALIDFQGMRLGLPAYDLASLIFDPYLAWKPERVAELLEMYEAEGGSPVAREELYGCAIQRLMQAIGAYANLTRNHGKPHYAKFISPAWKRLRWVAERHPCGCALLPLLSGPAPVAAAGGAAGA